MNMGLHYFCFSLCHKKIKQAKAKSKNPSLRTQRQETGNCAKKAHKVEQQMGRDKYTRPGMLTRKVITI